MIISLNLLIAVLGCAALFLFWLWQSSSGFRGFLFMLLGDAAIIGAVLYEQEASQMPEVVGIVLAITIIVLLLLCFVALIHVRRGQMPLTPPR